jgi:hypothetical protein
MLVYKQNFCLPSPRKTDNPHLENILTAHMLQVKVTRPNSMELNPSWEDNSFSAIQEL